MRMRVLLPRHPTRMHLRMHLRLHLRMHLPMQAHVDVAE
jgi:hypothetical protein